MRHIAKNGALPPLFADLEAGSAASSENVDPSSLVATTAAEVAEFGASVPTPPGGPSTRTQGEVPAAGGAPVPPKGSDFKLSLFAKEFTVNSKVPAFVPKPVTLPMAPETETVLRGEVEGPSADGAIAPLPSPPLSGSPSAQASDAAAMPGHGDASSDDASDASGAHLQRLLNLSIETPQAGAPGAAEAAEDHEQGSKSQPAAKAGTLSGDAAMVQGAEAESEGEYEEEEEDEDPDGFLVNTNRMNAMLPPDDESSSDED